MAMLRSAAGAALLAMAGAAGAHGEAKQGYAQDTTVAGEEYAFGRAGDPKKAMRTVRVDMSDKMRFSPASLKVKQGETVRFVVRNSGKMKHEMVIGSLRELKEHAEVMKNSPPMEHEEPFGVEVDAGRTGTLVWQFTKAGKFHFGCLIPGHFEAGMIGKVEVVK